jgi:hypothetical protein
MFTSRRLYAWLENKNYSSHQRLNEEYLNKNNKAWFEQWLVGVTDGDGTFSIVRQNNKWNLAFKITQSRYNLRLLYYIKKELGVGSVTKDSTKAQFFIRDRKKLNEIIFPIFDKYPLLTSKMFNYDKFKQAYSVLEDVNLTKEEKDIKLFELKDRAIPENYISPAWEKASLPLSSVNDINDVMSKPWLIGFIEAEGSFYLAGPLRGPASKDVNRIVPKNIISPAISHLNENSNYEEIKLVISKSWLTGFAEVAANFNILDGNVSGKVETEFMISHPQDAFLLYLIKRVLHIKNNVNKETKNYILRTKNSKSIGNIIKFFDGNFKGMKSLEFSLWKKANFFKDKNIKKFTKLSNISLKVKNKNSLSFVQKRQFSIVAKTAISKKPKTFFLQGFCCFYRRT